MQYNWPGNIRELRNVIERAVILEVLDTLQAESLPGEIVFLSEGIRPFMEIVNQIPISAEKQHLPFEININSEGFSLYDIEKQIIKQALIKTDNNQTQTSKLLGISRDTLRYKVKKYRL